MAEEEKNKPDTPEEKPAAEAAPAEEKPAKAVSYTHLTLPTNREV